MTDEDRVIITFREIYNQMQQVAIELRLLRQEYANDKSVKDDHEKRIRGLEAWKYGLPAALIAGVVGIILNFTMKG